MLSRTDRNMDEQPSGPLKAVQLRITGRVQGVGFRYWTARLAERMGVVGWVKNEMDGSVTVVCEGPEDRVNRFVQQVRQGPPGARVDHVEIMPLSQRGIYKKFSIEF
ncbi:MAG: hypothetical protein Kow009_01960 [Spirochaetales bacterium]